MKIIFAIYNSKDLKNWEYKSKTKGFFECPELFELPVDGNVNNKKWIMYGASGTYMIGNFDGEVFTPNRANIFIPGVVNMLLKHLIIYLEKEESR